MVGLFVCMMTWMTCNETRMGVVLAAFFLFHCFGFAVAVFASSVWDRHVNST